MALIMIWYIAGIKLEKQSEINSVTKLLEGNQRSEDVLLRSKTDEDGQAVFYYGVLEKNHSPLLFWVNTHSAVPIQNAPDPETCSILWGRF